MGANNRYSSKDRHEYNNQLIKAPKGDSTGLGLVITGIMLLVAAIGYGIYRLYENRKRNKAA